MAIEDAGAEVLGLADDRGVRHAVEHPRHLLRDRGEGAADDAHQDRRREPGAAAGLGAGTGGAVDHDVAVTVDLCFEARRDHGRRVVLLDDRRAHEPVARAQQFALVERGEVPFGAAVDLEHDLALLCHRLGRVAVAGGDGRGLQLVHAADADGADVDDLDRRVELVAVLGLVCRVEALLQSLHPGVVDGPGRHLRAHLVPLPGVAAVCEPPYETAVGRDGVGVELGYGLLDELVEARRQLRLVEALERVALGGDEFVLEVGCEQPCRSEDARVRWHEHASNLELERDVAREQWSRAAGGDESEFARVVAAPHRVELDRLGHPVLLDL